MIDLVFPKNNEKEFISMSVKLGYSGLCFVYNSVDELIRNKEKLKKSKSKLLFGLKFESKEKVYDFIITRASGKSRQILEKGKADIIYDFEKGSREDYIHHRASGLNQVLCKFARKNNVAVGFSVSSILNNEKKPVLLGRIKQNIKLCRKYKVRMIIGSFSSEPYKMRSLHDLISLFCLLGIHPSEAKKALSLFD